MKEFCDERWGLKPLSAEDELTRGGLTLKELWEALAIIVEVIKTVEKYWPSFKEGFVEGWEGA